MNMSSDSNSDKNTRPTTVWVIPLVFCLAYAFWPMSGLPRPFYAPQTRQVFWERVPDVILMGWYGRTIMALVTGIVVGWRLVLLARRLPETIRRQGPWLASASAVLAMVMTAIHEINKWMFR